MIAPTACFFPLKRKFNPMGFWHLCLLIPSLLFNLSMEKAWENLLTFEGIWESHEDTSGFTLSYYPLSKESLILEVLSRDDNPAEVSLYFIKDYNLFMIRYLPGEKPMTFQWLPDKSHGNHFVFETCQPKEKIIKKITIQKKHLQIKWQNKNNTTLFQWDKKE